MNVANIAPTDYSIGISAHLGRYARVHINQYTYPILYGILYRCTAHPQAQCGSRFIDLLKDASVFLVLIILQSQSSVYIYRNYRKKAFCRRHGPSEIKVREVMYDTENSEIEIG